MIGSHIAHYEILEQLGQGGMGVVYKAQDTKLNRVVALKFLPPELSRDKIAKSRFVHEARAASALDHAHICTIYEINETETGQMYIAMAYYSGESLKEKVERDPLPLDTAVNYAIQIAEGLTCAHNAEIVHRDIKPANVMVTDASEVKIVDFGLAKVAEQTQLTQTGSTIGTVAYMSPEQARGDDLDHRTDIWSFGVILYEMLTGRKPFRGDYHQAIIYTILNEEPQSIDEIQPKLKDVVLRSLAKNPEERYPTAAAMLEDLRLIRDGQPGMIAPRADVRVPWQRVFKPRILVPLAVGFVVLGALAIKYFEGQANERYAREELLPQIDELMESSWSDFTDVYALAIQAEEYIPDDQRLEMIFAESALWISVETEPRGADVYIKPYGSSQTDWRLLGTTPIDSVRVPIGIMRWRIEKEGYRPVLAAAATWKLSPGGKFFLPNDFFRVLDNEDSAPNGMVRVEGIDVPGGPSIDDFFIDRTEVTNRQFKAFIDDGGYKTPSYWEHTFVKDGEVLPWEEAVLAFVDQTGRPGPSTWQAGDFPQGQDEYPVSGISWYEAAAYAKYSGKRLPTNIHWGRARGEHTNLIRFPQLGGYATFAPFSNFGGTGPVKTTILDGITSFGAYDMSGNVREWCWNETAQGRLIRGGAFGDNTYLFNMESQAPPFDRSPKNGVRLALYPDPEKLPSEVFGTVIPQATLDFSKVQPVADDVFEIYKQQFFYDDTALNLQVESISDGEEWTHERLSFDAAYGDERIGAHLFLPKNATPPYQTVVYFPGTATLIQPSSENLEDYYEFPFFISFVVKSGRALLWPIYKGTFERRGERYRPMAMGQESYAFTEYLIQLVKDFRRSIDFLETRDDIDEDRIAYYGMSWGGVMGAFIPAVEGRIKANILVPGVLLDRGRPEAKQTNYLPHIQSPTLILAGIYDARQPPDETIRPMFNLLGTPAEDKSLILYPTDHIPPMKEVIRETLAWLDKYLGQVK